MKNKVNEKTAKQLTARQEEQARQEAALRQHFKYTIATQQAAKNSRKGVDK